MEPKSPLKSRASLLLAKRCLQVLVFMGGWVPVGAGFMGVLFGPSMLGLNVTLSVTFDSHYRYLSGLLLGIGLAFWSTLPDIEIKTPRFQLLTCVVVVGGLSRVVSLWAAGMPDRPMLFGLAMELVVTPLLALAQYRLACAFRKLPS